MFTGDNLLNVKTRKSSQDEYTYQSFDSFKNKNNVSVLGSTSKSIEFNYFNNCNLNYSSLSQIKNPSLYKLTFVNSKGIIREVTCLGKQKIYTCHRGYIYINNPNAKKYNSKINKADVFLDEEGYKNKLISSEEIEIDSSIQTLYYLDSIYKSNFFVNGILFK